MIRELCEDWGRDGDQGDCVCMRVCVCVCVCVFVLRFKSERKR